jgi:DNA-binding LytR/AlgR family response regulator
MKDNYLIISNRKRVHKIPYDDIVFISSNGMLITVYTVTGKKCSCSKNIGVIEEDLAHSDKFFRIHTSYIVSISKIREYHREDKEVEMICTTLLPVAKRRTNEFLQVYRKS